MEGKAMTPKPSKAGVDPANDHQPQSADPAMLESIGDAVRCEDIIPDRCHLGPLIPELHYGALVAIRGRRNAGQDTEQLLNDLIAECHFLMQDVALRTICQTVEPLERMRFMDTAMSFAVTGAKIADAIGRLRNGGAPAPGFHQHVTVERVDKPSGGGARSPRKQ
jgi:hypothetical protein